MPTITHPRFSFIRFGSDDYVLPAYAKFDAAFQFIVSDDYPTYADIYLRVARLDGTLIPDLFDVYNAPVKAVKIRQKLTLPVQYTNVPYYTVVAIEVNGVQRNYSNIYTYQDFLDAMYNDYGYRVIPSDNNNEFLDNGLNQSVMITFQYETNGPDGTDRVYLVNHWGQAWVQAPGTAIPASLKAGSCFRYALVNLGNAILGLSNPFKVHATGNYTTQLTYWNENDFAEFMYSGSDPKKNVVRLPMYFNKPTNPENIATSVLSNGEHRLESAFIEEQYEIVTEKEPYIFHRAMKMALRHRYIIADCNTLEETPTRLQSTDSYAAQWGDNRALRVRGKGAVLSADFGVLNTNYK